ncbi:MAG: peptidylprolyl isomerase [Candidatus Woesearchaeota archaeon]
MTTKKTHSKTAKKVYEGKKHDTYRTKKKKTVSDKKAWSIIGLTVIVAVIAVLALTPSLQNIFSSEDTMAGDNETVLATVDGETITEEEFNKQWNTLPPNVKLQVGKDALLEDIVNQQLLLNKAEEKGLETTSQEAEGFVNQQLTQAGRSMEEFKQQLEMQGLSYEDILLTYQKQLTIAKLFDQLNTSEVNVTDEEVEEYYENNRDQFYREQQVTVRHILIEVNNQTTDAKAEALAENISAQLDETNNSNFCTLVRNYSMDLGSKEDCGEYTFSRDRMDPAFENASFEMDIGERQVVKSQFGYHVILKRNESEAGYLDLDDMTSDQEGEQTPVRTAIRQQLSQERATAIYDEYVSKLRENATITYKNKDAIAENNTMNGAMENQTVVLDENISVATE